MNRPKIGLNVKVSNRDNPIIWTVVCAGEYYHKLLVNHSKEYAVSFVVDKLVNCVLLKSGGYVKYEYLEDFYKYYVPA